MTNGSNGKSENKEQDQEQKTVIHMADNNPATPTIFLNINGLNMP